MSDFDEMLRRAWEKYKIKKSMQEKHGKSYEQLKFKESVEFVEKHFKSILSVPIIIGILAAYLMYRDFGFPKLEEVLLSWTIGLTIVAAIITLLEKYTKILTK
jgi:hypothetical protein